MNTYVHIVFLVCMYMYVHVCMYCIQVDVQYIIGIWLVGNRSLAIITVD